MNLIPKAQNGLFNIDLRQDYSAPAGTTMVQSPIIKQIYNDNLSANKEIAKTEDVNKEQNLRATKIAYNKVKQQQKEQASSTDAAERQRQDAIARKYGMTYKDIVYKPIFERGSWQEKNYQNMMNEINNGIVDQMTDGHLFATKKGTRRILDSKGRWAAQSYVNMTDHVPGMAFGAFAPVATAAMYSVNPTAQTIAAVAGGDRDDQEKAGLYADLAMMLPFGMRRPQKFFSVADDAGGYFKYVPKPKELPPPPKLKDLIKKNPSDPEYSDIQDLQYIINKWQGTPSELGARSHKFLQWVENSKFYQDYIKSVGISNKLIVAPGSARRRFKDEEAFLTFFYDSVSRKPYRAEKNPSEYQKKAIAAFELAAHSFGRKASNKAKGYGKAQIISMQNHIQQIEKDWEKRLELLNFPKFQKEMEQYNRLKAEYDAAMQKYNEFQSNMPARYRKDSELFNPKPPSEGPNLEERLQKFKDVYAKCSGTENPSTLMLLNDDNFWFYSRLQPSDKFNPALGFRSQKAYTLEGGVPDPGNVQLGVHNNGTDPYRPIPEQHYEIARTNNYGKVYLSLGDGERYVARDHPADIITANFPLNNDNPITNRIKGVAQSMRDHYKKYWNFDLYDSLPGNVFIHPSPYAGHISQIKSESSHILGPPKLALTTSGLDGTTIHHELSHIVRSPWVFSIPGMHKKSVVSPEYIEEVEKRLKEYKQYTSSSYLPESSIAGRFEETLATLVERNNRLRAIAEDPANTLRDFEAKYLPSYSYIRNISQEEKDWLCDKILSLPEAERTPAKMLEILPQSVLDNIAASFSYRDYLRTLFAHVPAPVIDDWTIRYISQAAPIAGAAGALGASDWFQSNTEN